MWAAQVTLQPGGKPRTRARGGWVPPASLAHLRSSGFRSTAASAEGCPLHQCRGLRRIRGSESPGQGGVLKLPGDNRTDAAGPGPHFENHCSGEWGYLLLERGGSEALTTRNAPPGIAKPRTTSQIQTPACGFPTPSTNATPSSHVAGPWSLPAPVKLPLR